MYYSQCTKSQRGNPEVVKIKEVYRRISLKHFKQKQTHKQMEVTYKKKNKSINLQFYQGKYFSKLKAKVNYKSAVITSTQLGNTHFNTEGRL